jgi:uncharacterized membrane protein
MLLTRVDEATARVHLIVQANRSESWRANLVLLGGLGFVSFTIAGVFAYFGLWLVLPFAGLEMLGVTLGLYCTTRRLARREVITVSDALVSVSRGWRKPDEVRNLPRAWVRVEFRRSNSPFDNGILLLRAHQHRYSVGECLGRDEKQQLAGVLSSLLQSGGTHSFASQ